MRRYWEKNQDVRARADLGADPHALANVCTPGAPVWLNAHYACGQRAVFDRLLSCIPRSRGRALDVGCGGARWSEQLSELGWQVTGIDLQEALIENNRRRLPHIRFERVALQDFDPPAPFSLVCSVTVLGHIPHEDQPRALEKLRSITLPGSRILVLENILDQAPHVFANSVSDWTALFRDAGCTREALILYDFNPCMRALAGIRRRVGRVIRRSPPRVHPDDYLAIRDLEAPALPTVSEQAYWKLMSLAGAADRRVDPWLARRALTRPHPVHAGMVFARI